jgi:hypothetical protein
MDEAVALEDDLASLVREMSIDEGLIAIGAQRQGVLQEGAGAQRRLFHHLAPCRQRRDRAARHQLC